MTLEISDCTATQAEYSFEETAPAARLYPKGVGEIQDVLAHHPKAPRPHFFKQVAINIGLLFIHSITWMVHFFQWILKRCFGLESRQKALYRELHSIAEKGDHGQITEFLLEHSEDSYAASYLFTEFLALPELYLYLPEILKGANVCLHNDNGFFCRRWSEHAESYKRISSHNYQGEECYAIGHFLFWLDLEGNTRFQFEKSPLQGFFSTISHTIDYLRYKRDNEQQGVTGASAHTEHFHLRIEVDRDEFISRIL